MTSCGAWRRRTVTANGQPAVASCRCTDGSGIVRAWSIDVLTVAVEFIAGIASFLGDRHLPGSGLPLTLG